MCITQRLFHIIRSTCASHKFQSLRHKHTLLRTFCYFSNPVNLTDLYPTCPSIHHVRSYSFDKPKKQGKKTVELREDILGDYFNVEKLKHEMHDVTEFMKDQYQKHVSIRSIAGAIENIKIEFEGDEYLIHNLAQVNRKNPKVVALNFAAFPQTIPTVLSALQDSGMNLNPQQDGASVFVPIPKVTREHRQKLAKNAGAILVKCKSALNEIESKYRRKLEMKSVESPISIEQIRVLHEQLRLLTKQHVQELECMKNTKVKELTQDEDDED